MDAEALDAGEGVDGDMALGAEIRGYWEMRMDSLTEWWRAKAAEPRIWVRRIRRKGYELRETTCENSIGVILCCTGLTRSMAEAKRLLKAGGVEKRLEGYANGEWAKCKVGEELPRGEFVWLRRGRSYYGIALVMIPVGRQSLRYWREVMESYGTGD